MTDIPPNDEIIHQFFIPRPIPCNTPIVAEYFAHFELPSDQPSHISKQTITQIDSKYLHLSALTGYLAQHGLYMQGTASSDIPVIKINVQTVFQIPHYNPYSPTTELPSTILLPNGNAFPRLINNDMQKTSTYSDGEYITTIEFQVLNPARLFALISSTSIDTSPNGLADVEEDQFEAIFQQEKTNVLNQEFAYRAHPDKTNIPLVVQYQDFNFRIFSLQDQNDSTMQVHTAHTFFNPTSQPQTLTTTPKQKNVSFLNEPPTSFTYKNYSTFLSSYSNHYPNHLLDVFSMMSTTIPTYPTEKKPLFFLYPKLMQTKSDYIAQNGKKIAANTAFFFQNDLTPKDFFQSSTSSRFFHALFFQPDYGKIKSAVLSNNLNVPIQVFNYLPFYQCTPEFRSPIGTNAPNYRLEYNMDENIPNNSNCDETEKDENESEKNSDEKNASTLANFSEKEFKPGKLHRYPELVIDFTYVTGTATKQQITCMIEAISTSYQGTITYIPPDNDDIDTDNIIDDSITIQCAQKNNQDDESNNKKILVYDSYISHFVYPTHPIVVQLVGPIDSHNLPLFINFPLFSGSLNFYRFNRSIIRIDLNSPNNSGITFVNELLGPKLADFLSPNPSGPTEDPIPSLVPIILPTGIPLSSLITLHPTPHRKKFLPPKEKTEKNMLEKITTVTPAKVSIKGTKSSNKVVSSMNDDNFDLTGDKDTTTPRNKKSTNNKSNKNNNNDGAMNDESDNTLQDDNNSDDDEKKKNNSQKGRYKAKADELDLKITKSRGKTASTAIAIAPFKGLVNNLKIGRKKIETDSENSEIHEQTEEDDTAVSDEILTRRGAKILTKGGKKQIIPISRSGMLNKRGQVNNNNATESESEQEESSDDENTSKPLTSTSGLSLKSGKKNSKQDNSQNKKSSKSVKNSQSGFVTKSYQSDHDSNNDDDTDDEEAIPIIQKNCKISAKRGKKSQHFINTSNTEDISTISTSTSSSINKNQSQNNNINNGIHVPLDPNLKSDLVKLAQPLYQIQPPTTSQLPIAMLNLYSTELNASQQMVEYISQSNDQLHLHIRDTVKQNVLLFQQFQQQQMLMYQQQVQFNSMMTNLMKIKQQDMKLGTMKIKAQKEQMNDVVKSSQILAHNVGKHLKQLSNGKLLYNNNNNNNNNNNHNNNNNTNNNFNTTNPSNNGFSCLSDSDDHVLTGITYDELLALQQIDDLYHETKTLSQERTMKRNYIQYTQCLNTGNSTKQTPSLLTTNGGTSYHPKTTPDAFIDNVSSMSTLSSMTPNLANSRTGLIRSKDRKDISAIVSNLSPSSLTFNGGAPNPNAISGTRVNAVSAASALYSPSTTNSNTTNTNVPQNKLSNYGHGHHGLSSGNVRNQTASIHTNHTTGIPFSNENNVAQVKKRTKNGDTTDGLHFVSLHE